MIKARKMAIIVLLLIVSVMSACAKGNEEGTNSTNQVSGNEQNKQEADPKPEPEPKPADPVTIKFYNPYNDGDLEALKPLIANFEAENPDIKVDMVSLVPGNSVESLVKMDVALASNEQIDIAFLPSVEETMSRAALGVLAPLDDFYAAANINPEEEYYINPKYNGKYYGTMNSSTNWFVLINEDALKEAELPVPDFYWTWEDFREYAKKMNKGEGANKQYGAYFHNWGEYANMIAYTDRKNPFLTEQLTPQFDDPSFKTFFELRRAMEKEDKSVKPFADVIGAKLNFRTEFLTGKAAMLMTASFTLNNVGDLESYPHTFKTIVVPLPRSSGDAEPGLTHIGGTYLAIPANSKHKEEAFKFIRYITTDSKERLWLSGWKKVDAEGLVNRLYGKDKDWIDLDSLQTTLYDSKVKTSVSTDIAVPYANQLKKVLEDGFSKFILDNTSAEEAQQWMMEEADKIIKQNTK